LQTLEKKGSVKRKKSVKNTEEEKPEAPKIYRKIDESKKHQVTSFPDIKKVMIKPEHDFIILACDGIWDCFSNEQAVKFVRNRREKGPKNGVLSSSKLKSKTGLSEKSPLKLSSEAKSESLSTKKLKVKGETSFIIEEMMNQGIAKGDITMGDGTGTDNMTCILIQFRDPEDAKKDAEAKEENKSD
jgi:serine/threonine protein phosphatase PrpC